MNSTMSTKKLFSDWSRNYKTRIERIAQLYVLNDIICSSIQINICPMHGVHTHNSIIYTYTHVAVCIITDIILYIIRLHVCIMLLIFYYVFCLL